MIILVSIFCLMAAISWNHNIGKTVHWQLIKHITWLLSVVSFLWNSLILFLWNAWLSSNTSNEKILKSSRVWIERSLFRSLVFKCNTLLVPPLTNPLHAVFSNIVLFIIYLERVFSIKLKSQMPRKGHLESTSTLNLILS